MVEEIFDRTAAAKMGIDKKNQICILIHSGSRGLGHQVATDALNQMDKAMSRYKINLNDRQLACAPISSPEGQEYLQAMGAAANFAWVNRQSMTFLGAWLDCVSGTQPSDAPCSAPGVCKDVPLHARRFGHARRLRRLSQHR